MTRDVPSIDAGVETTFGASVARLPWWLAVGASASLVLLLTAAITWLFLVGVGIWGIRMPVGWGFAIANFVWWIGIGHAGTLISAILLLLRQGWRREINRFAEAMTLFAIACAGLFPILHLGRPDRFYWLLPYPNTMGVWPQWRSSLVWDVFAILTYATVSVVFFYLGLLPDLATLRDRARGVRQKLFGILALGWRGSARHWREYRTAYWLLAGLATPLVVSVHSIVATDFAIGVQPGWHSTLQPPFFVAGAILSGLAMVFVLGVPMRRFMGLDRFVTARHFDALARLTLVTAWIVGYGYACEFLFGWYGGEEVELAVLGDRLHGGRAPAFYAQVTCNVLLPQLLWWPRCRRSPLALFGIGCAVLVGMWIERFMIVVQSLEHGHLASASGAFQATFWDWATLAGSLGLFFLAMLLFVRLLPPVSIHEVKEQVADRPPDDSEPPRPVARSVEELRGRGAGRLLLEFAGRDEIVAAAKTLRAAGVAEVDAFTPTPVEGLGEALGLSPSRVARWTLAGGVLGLIGALGMQYWTGVVDYPIHVGGKALASWSAFVPIAFELTVLGAALATLVGLMVRTGLPRPHHPLFAVDGFERASQDRYFLCVPARGAPGVGWAHQGLVPLRALQVREVPG